MLDPTEDTLSASLTPTLAACVEKIEPLLPRLARVIKDREDDFLALGNGIFQINAAIGRFSSTASSLAESVSAGGVHDALAELNEESSQARDIFASVTTMDNLKGMGRAHELIEELDRAMGQFGRLVKTLKVLGITTRIESARLGSAGQGFTTLADDVESLAAKIVHYSEAIREHSRLLLTQVSTAQTRTSTSMHGHAQTVRTMFDRLFESIAELESMRRQSMSLVDDLTRDSRLVSGSMGQIVASVQFHDITRQQVEHVEEILRQAVREVQAMAGADDPVGMAAWIQDVLRLQTPQLRQAREMFQTAVRDLIGNLTGIGRKIADLKDKITTLAYGDTDCGQTILDTIRANIALVVDAMRQAGDQATNTGGIMAEVAQTVSQVSSFVADIEEVGAEIELIALNASVKAAHTGDQGRALGVLAVAIQNLSADARNHTKYVTEKLNEISHTASYLNDLAKSSDIGTLVAELHGKFTTLLDALAGLDTDMRAGVLTLSEMAEELAAQINTEAEGIQPHDHVGRELRELEGELSALSEHFAPFHAELDKASQPEKLKNLLTRYTMDSERLVHLAVFGHQDARAIDQTGDAGVDLFDADDNVELFDDGVDLFEDPNQMSAHADPVEAEEDFGDNVELF